VAGKRTIKPIQGELEQGEETLFAETRKGGIREKRGLMSAGGYVKVKSCSERGKKSEETGGGTLCIFRGEELREEKDVLPRGTLMKKEAKGEVQ